MEIGEKIRVIRNKEKLTQKAFAQLVGIGESTLQSIESGRKIPSGETILKLTTLPQFKKYGPFLLDLEDQANAESSQLMELVREVSDAGMEEQAVDYLRYLISKRGK